MSVFSKAPDPSNITGNKRPRVGPPMLDLCSEHNDTDCGNSCGSPGYLNIQLSDSFKASGSSPLRAQSWRKRRKNWSAGVNDRPSPRTESLVTSAVQWAERIMRKIDNVFPK